MDNQTIESVDKNLCTGCKMCGDICPNQAINFDVNSEGFWYPTIDNQKCTNCGLCNMKCPALNATAYDSKKMAYATWTKDDTIRRESTSGGIYYEFAKHILDNNGILVGCVYTEDFKGAYHIVSDKKEDLNKLLGSKYFQSDTATIFKQTKQALETGRQVLFTGSPCQVDALLQYLEKPYENLFTIDFICRGIPSPLIQKKKIELYEKDNSSEVVFYRDKSKRSSWANFGELIKFNNGKEKFISRFLDNINDCFVSKNLNMRESCYTCKYKNSNNASDITIGDFWGITKVTRKDLTYGVSALVINTDKGQQIFDAINSRIYKSQRPIEEVYKGNPAFTQSPKKPEARDSFFEDVNVKGLNYAVKKHTKKGLRGKLLAIYRSIHFVLQKPRFLLRNVFKINWLDFVKYNYFCKSIVRENGAYYIPFWGTNTVIKPNSKIILKDDACINYYPCYPRGNRNSFFLVGKGATVNINNKIEIAYGNTISVANDAELTTGFCFTGVNTNIICHKRITIGNNVMLGRDVCIFDSDYHIIYNTDATIINPDKEVTIEDNAWIGAKSMVLKGAIIKEGTIVGANTTVSSETENHKIYINKKESKAIGKPIFWQR